MYPKNRIIQWTKDTEPSPVLEKKMLKFIISPNKTRLAILAIVTICAIILAAMGRTGTVPYATDPRFTCIIGVLGFLMEFRYITLYPHKICINYFGILNRQIDKNRISNIEFVNNAKEYYLFFSIDGYPSFQKSNTTIFNYASWHHTKVIAIPIAPKKIDDYVSRISEIYSNVSFVNWKAEKKTD